MVNRTLFRHKYAPAMVVGGFAVLLSLITRIIILVAFGKSMSVSAPFISSFFIGLLYDIIVSLFIIIPFVLQITFTNNWIYTKLGKIVTILFFVVLLLLLLFSNLFPKDYNKDLYKAIQLYVSLRFAIYLFLCTRSLNFRFKWRAVVLLIFVSVCLFLLLFNVVSEFVFWQEFSGRYNFIAVDYLVYTNEVIGNITESYPILTIVIVIAIVACLCFLLVRKYVKASVKAGLRFSKRLLVATGLTLLAILLAFTINPAWVNFSANNYANELAGNGIYQFVQAFKNNELDFYRYYKTMDDATAFDITRKALTVNGDKFSGVDQFSTERLVNATAPENKMNVVLISVESLSAEFMQAFGSKKNITPFLDSLASRCYFFTNTYASGTRTVRGLEALALSIPPTPGESIVKRPGNEHLFSLGSVFKSKGYITQYIYGGYGYFDNMNYFFGNNDYDVIDRAAIKPEAIHYANIWGVADEDLFTLSLQKMDENYTLGRPFFTQVMTVSNHRPFTYPDGRIDIPSSEHSRDGAVKYTDYAIGDFIKRASLKPWFNNTVFVIVADHCASSAGSTSLPVTGYHIPLLVYSPLWSPKIIETLTAQVDIPPTILALLHFSYTSKFFGINVLDSLHQNNRAFISTYQGLGLIIDSQLIVQSPLKTIATFSPDFATGKAKEVAHNKSLEQKAIAYYQAAAFVIKNNKYRRVKK